MKITFDPNKTYSRPEELWTIGDQYEAGYRERVEYGRVEARRQKLAIVSIARNSMPWLKNTLRLVDELAGLWRDCCYYIYENDSTDGTAEALDDYALRQWVTVEHDTLPGLDCRGWDRERTERLAHCRSRCQTWVKHHAADANYVMVLDTDPHGGFSVDGVLNSLGWFCEMLGDSWNRREPGAMASYSLLIAKLSAGDYKAAQHDAWAAKLNTWDDDRNHDWFHHLMPPIGSSPIPMNSAFGGLCLYRREAYLSGKYDGSTCEHVGFHRSMRNAGYQLFLNPGSRYVAMLP